MVEDGYNLKNPAVKRILQEMQVNPSNDFMGLPLELSPYLLCWGRYIGAHMGVADGCRSWWDRSDSIILWQDQKLINCSGWLPSLTGLHLPLPAKCSCSKFKLPVCVFNHLAGNFMEAKLAWAAAKHGGVVYILELLLPLQEKVPLQQRAAAASLLGKLVGQPMHGPRVAITLARFLPDGLVSAVRDGPGESVVAALEQTTETPELVWTPAMATSLSAQIATMASDLYHE